MGTGLSTTDSHAQRPERPGDLASRWRLRRWRLLVERIRACEEPLRTLRVEQLAQRSAALRRRVVFEGAALDQLLPEAFALVGEACDRHLGLRPYDAQLFGAVAMHHGFIAEMQTGEGKTLTATLPVYLHALGGQGVHVATANDYLARRDAEWMQPVYASLGLTVGYIQALMPPQPRREGYRCHVTYGTAKEFGFDYLRDRLLQRRLRNQRTVSPRGAPAAAQEDAVPVQRRAALALIDEADSILIDEAQTPLIIAGLRGGGDPRTVPLLRWCAEVAPRFAEGAHFRYDEQTRDVELTETGRQLAESLDRPPPLGELPGTALQRGIQRAIKVARDFHRDRHYVIRNGQVVIVDEFTGRLGEGRKWRHGIHEAVEAKEGLEITQATSQDAQITMQELFALYPRLAGMTGTAVSARGELKRAYGLSVVTIPTHRSSRRVELPERVLATVDQKWSAVVDEVRELQRAGRPVLVGTRSIDKSEQLSQLLAQAGVEHVVLNARQNADEARIIEQAGQAGRVTVATNMAGRGTDIRLGPGVAQRGGLHVICTELHESRRVDRQLVGRCGRQGDPGSVRFFLSLEDEILTASLGAARAARVAQWARQQPEEKLGRQARLLRAAQRRVERKRLRARQQLTRYARQRANRIAGLGLDPCLELWIQ